MNRSARRRRPGKPGDFGGLGTPDGQVVRRHRSRSGNQRQAGDTPLAMHYVIEQGAEGDFDRKLLDREMERRDEH